MHKLLLRSAIARRSSTIPNHFLRNNFTKTYFYSVSTLSEQTQPEARQLISLKELEFSEASEIQECNTTISNFQSNPNVNTDKIPIINTLMKRCFINLIYYTNLEQCKADIATIENMMENIDLLDQVENLEVFNLIKSKTKILELTLLIKEKQDKTLADGLSPLLEKRANEYANIGNYKMTLDDLNTCISGLEKQYSHLLKETEAGDHFKAEKVHTQLIHLYKARMSLYVDIKGEMERLLDICRETKDLSYTSSPEAICLFFTTGSLVDRRHKLNGGNIQLLRTFDDIFSKDEERVTVWDVTNPHNLYSNAQGLSENVLDTCVSVVGKDLERVQQLTKNETEFAFNFGNIEEAVDKELKQIKRFKFNKYLFAVSMIILLLFALLEQAGIISRKSIQ